MTLADLPQVQALSAREKLQLVDELWTEVAHQVDTLDVTAEEKQLLDQRWERFLNNPSSALALEDFQKRLQAFRTREILGLPKRPTGMMSMDIMAWGTASSKFSIRISPLS